jgi:hypothetical protein
MKAEKILSDIDRFEKLLMRNLEPRYVYVPYIIKTKGPLILRGYSGFGTDHYVKIKIGQILEKLCRSQK